MKKLLLSFVVLLALGSVQAQINFQDDFETPVADGAAIGTWQTFTNVFGPSFYYGYPGGIAPNTGMAPNGGAGWSSIGTAGVGPNGGTQFLNTYSDYGNGDHGNAGVFIEANIFQSFTIGSLDLNEEYTFSFDSRLAEAPFTPDPTSGNVEALQAFIKVFVPDFSSTVAFETLDISSTAWVEGNELTVTIDPAWDGFPLQIGFLNRAGGYESTGVWYDNVSFAQTPEVIIPTMGQWALLILGLMITSLGLVYIKRTSVA